MVRQNGILRYIFDIPSPASTMAGPRITTDHDGNDDEDDAYDGWGDAKAIAEQTLFDDREPVIIAISPVLSAYSGCEMVLTGQFISRNTVITIGGAPAKILRYTLEYPDDSKRGAKDYETAEVVIRLKSPPLASEGFKEVEVRNPLGGRAVLEGVVYYSPHDFSEETPPPSRYAMARPVGF